MSTPNEKPIILKGEMVRAVLEGKKTQTRRIIKPQPLCYDQNKFKSLIPKCPQGLPGDRLWVRESFFSQGQHESDGMRCHYKADADYIDQIQIKWKPSIHMPRWASRITLEIMDVRVERLQEITEEDAHKSGVATGRWGYRKQWEEFYGPESWLNNPWVWVIGFRKI